MTKFFTPILAAFFAAIASASDTTPPSEAKLLRFPATDGSHIAFTYANQIYTVGIEGGVARRLTNSPGYAIFPRFSPDGTQLAFTAQYDGNTEVYVMAAQGGEPRRMTYTASTPRDDLSDRLGPNNIVMGWKSDSSEIVFRTRMREGDSFKGALMTVAADGDLPRSLPVPYGGFVSFSPDNTKIAYNRIFREFRTWKDYRGGMADDVWILDLKSGAIENITNNPACDIIPMWGNDNKIYFASDRDKRMNLYSYDLATKATVELTHFKDYDLKFPSIGGGKIVFELAGEVWVYDLKSGAAHPVAIRVLEDLATTRPTLMNVSPFISDVSPSPDGKRVMVNARGATFSVPAKDGPTRIVSATPGVHERDVEWSPDGKRIAYISDATGENELYVRNQDGTGQPVQLTKGADTYYFHELWSPDGKKLLFGDRLMRLRILDTETRALTVVDTAPAGQIRNYAWSPDSQWVSWSRPEDDALNTVWLYNLATTKKVQVTDGTFFADMPSFSRDGKFLCLVSSRDFKPTFSEVNVPHADNEIETVYLDMQRVYLVVLSKSTDSPFKPKSDEVDLTPAKSDDKTDAKDEKKDDKKVTVTVDADGIQERIIGLPVSASNYDTLTAVDDKVYYLRSEADNSDDDTEGPASASKTLAFYDLKERKETVVAKVSSYEITWDSKKALIVIGSDNAIVDLPTAKLEVKDKISFASLQMTVVPRAEWAQIYDECWRQMRDFFYSPTMNGVDWKKMHDKYAGLVPYAQTRYDLTYLIGELIGELHSGHAYVGGGDRPIAPKKPVGQLGAELSRDGATRAYRIDRILPGDNWEEAGRSPLTEIGVNVHEGDYILAVDAVPVSTLSNIYQALVGKVGKQVVLQVNAKPSTEGSRSVTIVPIADEAPLYYRARVRHNTEYVLSRTNGQVGYIHIPDMGLEGLNTFTKQFYPQLRRKALIIDDRSNGGGFCSPIVIERLRRALDMWEKGRNETFVNSPAAVHYGPKVLLLDEFAASDGDIFPARFKLNGMGKTIGKRSWGGVVGITATLPLVDGGFLNRPEFAPVVSRDGTVWPVESHGVDPDIVVDNDPSKEFHGIDQQLDRAIDEVMADLKAHPPVQPTPPPYPDRS